MRSARAAPCTMSLLLLLLLLGPGPAASHGSKYSREKNQPELAPKRAPEQEFRMEKLNQLWDKAHRVSAGPLLIAGFCAHGPTRVLIRPSG